MSQITRLVVQTFTKVHDLILRADACQLLTAVLKDTHEDELDEAICSIVWAYQKLNAADNIVTREHIEKALQYLTQAQAVPKDASSCFEVISSFDMARFAYSADRRTFVQAAGPTLCASAEAKTKVYRGRYELIKQRVVRRLHEIKNSLNTSAWGSADEQHDEYSCRLTPINALKGSEGKKIVFGMLSEIKEGRIYLEDPDGHVELVLRPKPGSLNALAGGTDPKMSQSVGFYNETCFVIAEGHYHDGQFWAHHIMLPPAEDASVSRATYPGVNFFGGRLDADDYASTRQLEGADPDAMLVILSDVWLDHPKVLQKLDVLFGGFAQAPPTAFILFGRFFSRPFVHQSDHVHAYQQGFGKLAELIKKYPLLEHKSRFVIIPGADDPGFGSLVPRPPVLSRFIPKAFSGMASVTFASNPCRIRCYTQELVFYRDDLLDRMRRNCLLPPTEDETKDLKKHLVKTLLDEAHLTPLPLRLRPILWEYDHALRLYPRPDLLVLADKCEPYSMKCQGCVCANPGGFMNTEFGFLAYYPSTRSIEPSSLATQTPPLNDE